MVSAISDYGYCEELGSRTVVDAQIDFLDVADAVIRELDAEFLDFALWLSQELRGEPISRADAESCVQEWKWLHDESRWLKGEGSR